MIGQNTDQVLRDYGYGDEEIADLAEKGIIGFG
jgi:crotonobetainyl-CoA:carnitine CoA-transferase CaiB-like acyl-CoA transferase